MLARDAREGVADESTRSTHGDARACGVRVIRFFHFISFRRAAAAKDDETREERRGEDGERGVGERRGGRGGKMGARAR